jgi:hypothetical protein
MLVRLHNQVRRTTQVQVYAVCLNPAQLLSYMEQTTPRLLGDAFMGFLIVRRVWSGLMLLTLPAVFYFLAN